MIDHNIKDTERLLTLNLHTRKISLWANNVVILNSEQASIMEFSPRQLTFREEVKHKRKIAMDHNTGCNSLYVHCDAAEAIPVGVRQFFKSASRPDRMPIAHTSNQSSVTDLKLKPHNWQQHCLTRTLPATCIVLTRIATTMARRTANCRNGLRLLTEELLSTWLVAFIRIFSFKIDTCWMQSMPKFDWWETWIFNLLGEKQGFVLSHARRSEPLR